jgi:DNA-binding GntR family transcriptional regulator
VFVAAAANRALASAVARLTPLIRRLERLRFGSLPGRTSIREHERIIDACERGDTEAAARLTYDNWANLGELIARAFEAEVSP